jgi:hypothetical protein
MKQKKGPGWLFVHSLCNNSILKVLPANRDFLEKSIQTLSIIKEPTSPVHNIEYASRSLK